MGNRLRLPVSGAVPSMPLFRPCRAHFFDRSPYPGRWPGRWPGLDYVAPSALRNSRRSPVAGRRSPVSHAYFLFPVPCLLFIRLGYVALQRSG